MLKVHRPKLDQDIVGGIAIESSATLVEGTLNQFCLQNFRRVCLLLSLPQSSFEVETGDSFRVDFYDISVEQHLLQNTQRPFKGVGHFEFALPIVSVAGEMRVDDSFIQCIHCMVEGRNIPIVSRFVVGEFVEDSTVITSPYNVRRQESSTLFMVDGREIRRADYIPNDPGGGGKISNAA